MSAHKIANRYATALFNEAISLNQLQAVNDDVKLLLKTTREHKEFAAVLKSPVIRPDKKTNILNEVFEGKFSKLSLLFFDLIIKKSRASITLEIAHEFEKLYNINQNILVAKLVTADPIADALAKEFQAVVAKETGKTVQLERGVNPDLIAGFVLKVDDIQWDASMSRKLSDLREELLSHN